MDIDVSAGQAATVEAIPVQRGATACEPDAPLADCQCRSCRNARFV